MSKTPNSVPDLDPALNMRVQQFYFHEAQMLDDKRFRDWLAMFDKSATYRVPIRRTMPPRERKVEFSSEHDLSIFDENYRDLEQRIEKLETGKAWAEEPPSRTRHCITNVRIWRDSENLLVRTNFSVFQGRFDRDTHYFFGERHDVLKESDGTFGLSLSSRLVLLDHTTLEVPSVSIFF
jgi:chlorobenzene dioxygenase small subunit/benzene/toluene dioxygenase beta subunit